MNIFSATRSLSGIYRELRQLRRLAESYFDFIGVPLPKTPMERLKDRMSVATSSVLRKTESHQGDTYDGEIGPDGLNDAGETAGENEEVIARRRVQEIVKNLSEGRDPGTDYRPWY